MRSKIGAPSSFSSARICRLISEEATLSRTAALRIDPKPEASSRYLCTRDCTIVLILDRRRCRRGHPPRSADNLIGLHKASAPMPQRHHSRRNLMLLLPFNSRTVLSRAVLARIVHGSQLPLPKAPTAMTGHTMSRFRTACMTAAAALLLALGPAKAA